MSENVRNTYVDEFCGERPEEDFALSCCDLDMNRKEIRSLQFGLE